MERGVKRYYMSRVIGAFMGEYDRKDLSSCD